MAVPIKMQFGMLIPVGTENHVLGWGAHWHHRTNTVEPSVCGGDAALC